MINKIGFSSFESIYAHQYSKTHFNDIVEWVYTHPGVSVSQSQLCNFQPGIYFNISCRNRLETKNDNNRNMQYIAPDYKEVHNSITKLSNNPIHRKLQTDAIENKLKRRKYLKNYYTSNRFASRKVKNIITRQQRIPKKRETIAKEIEKLQKRQMEMQEELNEPIPITTSPTPPWRFYRKRIITKRKKKVDKELKRFLNDQTKLEYDDKLLAKIHNEYMDPTNIHRHRAHTLANGSYVKVRGKWVKKNKSMKHKSMKHKSKK